MNKTKVSKFKVEDIEPFEHLEFIVRNSTPQERYKGLEKLWNLWYCVRKTLPQRIVDLQDKFREERF